MPGAQISGTGQAQIEHSSGWGPRPGPSRPPSLPSSAAGAASAGCRAAGRRASGWWDRCPVAPPPPSAPHQTGSAWQAAAAGRRGGASAAGRECATWLGWAARQPRAVRSEPLAEPPPQPRQKGPSPKPQPHKKHLGKPAVPPIHPSTHTASLDPPAPALWPPKPRLLWLYAPHLGDIGSPPASVDALTKRRRKKHPPAGRPASASRPACRGCPCPCRAAGRPPLCPQRTAAVSAGHGRAGHSAARRGTWHAAPEPHSAAGQKGRPRPSRCRRPAPTHPPSRCS